MHAVLQTELFPKSRLSLDALSVFSDAVGEERGAVHTRPEVSEFVLDAVGWVEAAPLDSFRLLKPTGRAGVRFSIGRTSMSPSSKNRWNFCSQMAASALSVRTAG